MKSINVAYVMHSSTLQEGSNRSLLNMLDGLMMKGVSPYLILPENEDKSIYDEINKRKIPYIVLTYFLSVWPYVGGLKDYVLFIPRYIKIRMCNLIALLKIMRYVKLNKVDIIHSNVGPLLIGYQCARILNIKHVWHLREYQDLDFNFKTLYSKKSFKKKLLAANNHVIAITLGIYNHFDLSKNSRIIYNGIMRSNEVYFSEHKKKYFLYVGRLTENKGARVLVEAFIEFTKDNNEFYLYFAGQVTPDYQQTLIDLAKKNGIENQIKFLGPRDDVYELMRHAYTLIVPSLHEGFGRITVEAMYNGCLVIGNNSAGTNEILERDKLGILYTGTKGLLHAIKNVVNNGIEFYFPMIHMAQITAAKLYSQEANSTSVYNYYKEIITH
ncbi:glycosyltransferase [Inquilinus sp. KBS0705]|nr:glycosyltransferase [Inquilinus sp. KBS0705]